MKIEKEDFDAWRDNPVTEEVFRVVQRIVDRAKQKWLAVSWEGGSADPLMLADLRARAEIANDLVNLTYEELNDESERDLPNRVQGADRPEAG